MWLCYCLCDAGRRASFRGCSLQESRGAEPASCCCCSGTGAAAADVCPALSQLLGLVSPGGKWVVVGGGPHSITTAVNRRGQSSTWLVAEQNHSSDLNEAARIQTDEAAAFQMCLRAHAHNSDTIFQNKTPHWSACSWFCCIDSSPLAPKLRFFSAVVLKMGRRPGRHRRGAACKHAWCKKLCVIIHFMKGGNAYESTWTHHVNTPELTCSKLMERKNNNSTNLHSNIKDLWFFNIRIKVVRFTVNSYIKIKSELIYTYIKAHHKLRFMILLKKILRLRNTVCYNYLAVMKPKNYKRKVFIKTEAGVKAQTLISLKWKWRNKDGGFSC